MKKLKQWVDAQGGPKVVARKLGVHWRAVYFWLQGVNIPRHKTQTKIRALSRGRIKQTDF